MCNLHEEQEGRINKPGTCVQLGPGSGGTHTLTHTHADSCQSDLESSVLFVKSDTVPQPL